MKTQNKIIVVTGGGSGVGRELVLGLLEKKALVAAVDINTQGLETTLAQAGNPGTLRTYTADITNLEAVISLYEKIKTDFGAVDGIINNAGIIQPFLKLNDLSLDLAEKVLRVNLYGVLYMTKQFLPELLSRPEAHIVNISSMGGFLPVPGQTIYCASKAAVKLLTEGLSSELAGTKVGTSVVFPGAIQTNIMANSGLKAPDSAPEGKGFKGLSAKQAAAIIIDAMENKKHRVVAGKDAKFFDLFYRFSPGRASRFIAAKMKGLLKD